MLKNFIIICGIAFSVVIAYEIQKKFLPTTYFGFKEYVYYQPEPLQVKHIITKAAVIIIITVIWYLFFQHDLIIMGISLGCFLLIWPEILSAEYSYKYSPKAKLLLLFIYICFICTSGLLASLTISLINYYSISEVIKKLFNFVISFCGIPIFKYFLDLQLTKDHEEIEAFDTNQEHSVKIITDHQYYVNYVGDEIASDVDFGDKLEDKINEIIDIKPILGAPKWYLTSCQWLWDNIALVQMEDGHISTALYIEYDINNGDCNCQLKSEPS